MTKARIPAAIRAGVEGITGVMLKIGMLELAEGVTLPEGVEDVMVTLPRFRFERAAIVRRGFMHLSQGGSRSRRAGGHGAGRRASGRLPAQHARDRVGERLGGMECRCFEDPAMNLWAMACGRFPVSNIFGKKCLEV